MPVHLHQLKERLRGRKIVIYGIGLIGFEAMSIIEQIEMIPVEFFVDRRSNIVDRAYGKPVKSKKELNAGEHYVIIAPPNFYSQIAMELCEIGYSEYEDYCPYSELRGETVCLDGVRLGKHTNGFAAFTDCLGEHTKNYISGIGNFCSINKSAMVGADHNFLLSTSHEVFQLNAAVRQFSHNVRTAQANRISIGHDVWIGANVFINASKVKSIGNGAVIAAGAIVIEDVPPYAIVAGIPAKIKKYRFSPKQIEVLQQIKWWDWPDEEIAANISCFLQEDLFFSKYLDRGETE